jgi:hypothetical protein
MRILATVIAGTMLATSAVAEVTVTKETLPALGPVVSGEISLDFAETAANKTGGVMGVDLNIDAGSLASVDLDFSVKDGQALTLDNWTVGTTVGSVALAFGDDNNLMPETEANTATDGTLAKPAMSESLTASVGGASVAVGLTDWTADVTDISNVQGAYTIDMDRFAITGAMDYNVDSENTVFGGAVSGIDLGLVNAGGALTYDTDAGLFAYEGTVGTNGLTAYINGNDTNKLQHVGGEYTMNYAGAELSAGVDYDTDAENFTPTAGLSFSF